MRQWNALMGLFLAAQIGFVAFAGQADPKDPMTGLQVTGHSCVTQASMASPAQYDTYFGDNWGSVRVFQLMETYRPLRIYVNTSSRLYSPQYKEYITWSLDSWSKALDGRLRYEFTSDPRDADITVDWVPRFSDRYIAGLTTFQVGHADIQIKTMGVPEKDIKANIIHEFGHALGIAGHSSNPNDIMVGARRFRHGAEAASYEPQLSRADIQAIRRLYSPTWQRGEDLYSPIAQRAVLPPYGGVLAVTQNGNMVNTSSSNVLNLKPMDNYLLDVNH
ncbi:MAG TPA: matrixin family metalloprotease [Oculatellaceae cyanobacterium]